LKIFKMKKNRRKSQEDVGEKKRRESATEKTSVISVD